MQANKQEEAVVLSSGNNTTAKCLITHCNWRFTFLNTICPGSSINVHGADALLILFPLQVKCS